MPTARCSAFVIQGPERYWGKVLNQEGYPKIPKEPNASSKPEKPYMSKHHASKYFICVCCSR